MPTTPEHGLSVRDALSPLFAGYYCCCPRISILSLINRSKERKDCLSSQLPHCFSCFLCQLVDQRYRCSVRVMTHSIVLNLILILACNHSVLVFTGLTDCNCMPQRERESRMEIRSSVISSLGRSLLHCTLQSTPWHSSCIKAVVVEAASQITCRDAGVTVHIHVQQSQESWHCMAKTQERH